MPCFNEYDQQNSTPDGVVDYYLPQVLTANDYYPFGMGMPGRKFAANGAYRYGFNGKEKDKDINSLTAYDYGFRIYNPAIGRFLSEDPLTKEYPWYTPYQFAGNTPIQAIDLDGAEPLFHKTQSSASAYSINLYGFNGRSFGNYSSYNWFMVDPGSQTGGGNVTNSRGPTLKVEGLDRSKVDIITTAQTDAWAEKSAKELGYESKSALYKQSNKTENGVALRSAMWEKVYQKVGAYMDKMKQPGYFLEKDGTYAFSDEMVNSKNVKISQISGEGAANVVKLSQRQALKGEAAAALESYNKAGTMMKWGGRLCIAFAAGSDIYDIYQSDNKTREITKKVASWSSGLAMAGWGATSGNPIAVVVGFGIGYFIGDKVTEIVYDYFFSPGVSRQ